MSSNAFIAKKMSQKPFELWPRALRSCCSFSSPAAIKRYLSAPFHTLSKASVLSSSGISRKSATEIGLFFFFRARFLDECRKTIVMFDMIPRIQGCASFDPAHVTFRIEYFTVTERNIRSDRSFENRRPSVCDFCIFVDHIVLHVRPLHFNSMGGQAVLASRHYAPPVRKVDTDEDVSDSCHSKITQDRSSRSNIYGP